MSDIVIAIEGLGKQYHIGKKQDSYMTITATLASVITEPLRKVARLLRGKISSVDGLDETFWALQDVSFSVRQGEIIGIIGRNGAGKSTLLKLLSRIVEPTTGHAEIRGRVGSLLEVGTGFHPQLTGRDNIFLNGAILGMRRSEIERKFDEIVAFAEVERFIDTPVKHYSSGMYLRLAFAVAAHLEPEILIVDEVLAVGDDRFQKKCIAKMEDVRHHGRTVLFVSHNMGAVARLCERVVLLDEGRVVQDGPAHTVIGSYIRAEDTLSAERIWSEPATAPGGDIARVTAVRVTTEGGEVANAFDIRNPLGIEMEYEVLKPGFVMLPHFNLDNNDGIAVFTSIDNDPSWRGKARPVGHYRSRVRVPGNLLSEGVYFLEPCLLTTTPRTTQFTVTAAVSFRIIDSFEGDSARVDWLGPMTGVVRPLLTWTTSYHRNGARAD